MLPLRVLILAQARRGRLFGLLLLGLGAVFHAFTAFAQESRFVFNIPAQALDTALAGRDVRFDVVAIDAGPDGGAPVVRWIRDAFRMRG